MIPNLSHALTDALAAQDSSFRLIQDGVEFSASRLLSDAQKISHQINEHHHRRIALRSRRIDRLIVALLACELSDCELLMVRPGIDPALVEVGGVLNVCGSIEDNSTNLDQLDSEPATTNGFAILIMTSGTTGVPKVASHNVEALVQGIRVPKGAGSARWLLTYEPTSFAGLQVILTAVLGGNLLAASVTPTVASLAQLATDQQVTHISGTPTFWRAFLMVLGKAGSLSSLKQVTLGGEAVDQSTLARLAATFPDALITHIYASTEAGVLFSVKDGRAGFPAKWLEERKGDEEITAVKMRIRNGILEAKSARQMRSYVHSTGAKNPLTEDGWIVTGDLVEVREDRVIFLGRADRMINIGGLKVTPEEIEGVLLQIPDVAEARVFGAANPITGQILAAEIVPATGVDRDALRQTILAYTQKVLSPQKIPRVIRFVETIQATDAGKKSR